MEDTINTGYLRYEQLLRDVKDARSKIGGSDRSAPGSLRTWEEYARALDRKVASVRASIRVAEDEMKRLNPRYRTRKVKP